MKGIVTLRKPVRIGGEEVRELSYDTDKISVDMYMKAMNRVVTLGNGITGANVKIDAGAQLVLGMYAVIADNPKYEIEDIELIKGGDLMQFQEIGMAFTLGREDQTEEPSDQQSEPTHKRTTQTSQDSDK